MAGAKRVSSEVNGGDLALSSAAVTFRGAALGCQPDDQPHLGIEWAVTAARGMVVECTATISSSDLNSAGTSVENTDRTT